MALQTSDESPFLKRLAYTLVSFISLGYLAILAKELLSPLLFAVLFSILLLPFANYLEKKWKLHRGLASFFALLVFATFISFIVYFLGHQMSKLAEDGPMFQKQLNDSIESIQKWISRTYHVNSKKQLSYLTNAAEGLVSSSTVIVSTTVLSVSSILLFLIFTTIDTFFLLLYRRLIVEFLVSVFKEKNEKTVLSVLKQVQNILRKYILGLLIEMAVVTSMACIAFMLLGIKYPILLGLLTGIFNLVPYVGIFTALILSVLITFASAATPSIVLFVALSVIIIHLIDSNILLPLVVGSKVKINALITLLGVIVGEMIWGISGMFLSIPVIAVAKIVFDRVESLQPWGKLLGEESKNTPKTIIRDNSAQDKMSPSKG